MGWGLLAKGHKGTFRADGTVLISLVVVVTFLCAFVKIYQSVHFKTVDFISVNYTSINMGQEQSPYLQGTLGQERDPW